METFLLVGYIVHRKKQKIYQNIQSKVLFTTKLFIIILYFLIRFGLFIAEWLI